MKSTFLLLPLFALSALLTSCSVGGGYNGSETFEVSIVLPATIEVDPDGSECTFEVKDGKAPLETDIFMLESSSGISTVCPVVSVTPSAVTIFIDGVQTGEYRAYIKRDNMKKPLGMTFVNIVSKIDFTPDEGTTVWGLVTCDGESVPGVVVSDGIEVVTTGEDGIYQLKSEKKWGYVFISVPSGYEVPLDGILPQFHYYLRSDKDVLERADFTLTKVDGQDSYKVFMLGDMHLANRTNDLSQFRDFTDDLNDYINAHKGEKMYAITLGDMTWDLYWYDNDYCFPEYLHAMETNLLTDLHVFHTMGNHDNDYKTYSDFDAAFRYVKDICPTYYSFNIGKIHYVVLDDIDCSDYDGTTSRNYGKNITTEQLEWLKKDLSYIDISTPLIITTHAQIFYPSGSGFRYDRILHSDIDELFSILEGRKVHFVTGHTHVVFNVEPEDGIVGGADFHEHNSGSICASWWWSGSNSCTPGVHISLDGAPGGYAVWDVDGTDFKYIYKSTGWDEDYQFRSYDLNNVSFSFDDIPECPSNVQGSFRKYVTAYPENTDNYVLINIWNWNSNWTLAVTDETGKALEWEQVGAYDPLHIAALSVPRFNKSNLSGVPNFITEKYWHFFKVKCDDADVDLTITVQDEFGHTWTEQMKRPKEFSTDAYKNI